MTEIIHDPETGREIHVLRLRNPSTHEMSLPDLGQDGYVCMLWCDDTNVDRDDLQKLALQILGPRCGYVCTVGPESEWIHDCMDEEIVMRQIDRGEDLNTMTTWHVDEPVDDSIYYLLCDTTPMEEWIGVVKRTYLIFVGENPVYDKVMNLLADPVGLRRRYLESD